MKRKLGLLVNISMLLLMILSLTVNLGHAQGGDPPLPEEEPGEVPGAEMQGAERGIAPMARAFSGGPNYDSGWISLGQDEARTLTHNLGGDTDNYVVDMQYMGSSFSGVNQRYYGGADFGTNPPSGSNEDDRVGAYWRSLTDSSITVYRRPEDIYASKVRIRIWIDPSNQYDSGWINLSPGAAATTLNHNVGGDADDYVVDLQYRNGSSVNQRYYGGADFGATAFDGSREDDRVGAYWRTLDNATITVYRRPEDTYADQVRVRIWERPTPTYDSGWVSVNQDTAQTLLHNIGGNPEDYVVDMQYRNSGSSGVNQCYYGGADFGANMGGASDWRVGAYWRSLDADSITVYRRPEDVYAEQVRVRIWHFWSPSPPDYSSGWLDLDTGDAATTLTHNLGGDTGDYLVDLQYRGSAFSGVNRRYYGGADFCANAPSGASEDDRVGAYWRSLTNSTVTVYRRPDDIYASEVRLRIWVMPQADYDSGWVALAQNTSQDLTHNLGGSVHDYFVDMQYGGGGNGINQRYYGGVDLGANPPGGMSADDRVGAYWRNLYNNTITVYRRPEDIYAPEVRVRIWRMAEPDYNSGWQLVNVGESQTWSHNIGGIVDGYLVNMVYVDTAFNMINARHLGGVDFGANPPGGYSADDRAGAYWRALTDTDITVYRRPEDGFADYLRIRIWDTGSRVYLPLVMRN